MIEGAMKYNQIVIVLVLVAMIIGIFALVNMPRNEFPDFTVRQGLVIGIYPGATSAEVEEKLTTDVEDYIFSYEEVDKNDTYSKSEEGQMIVYVELNDDVNEKEADLFWVKFRHGLNELKASLPSGVLALVGTNDFGDTSAFLITMSSEKRTYRELEDYIELLEADIRKIESVSKVKRYGTQDEKVYVYVDKEKLNEYNIQPASIFASFKAHEFLDYAGELDDGKLILPVHIPPRFTCEKDLEEQIIIATPGGNIVRLKDIARVERRYDDPDNYIRNNGNNALLLSLEMQEGNNIVQYGEEVQEVLKEFREKIPGDIKVNVISNQPDVVAHSISHFMKEFMFAILGVILVTMILLPFRVSSVAAVTIPISVLIAMGIMQMVGLQLDIVSLAGLIVVLGMVVDNAIVVIDSHVEKLDHGIDPWNAAWQAATELYIPVLSATTAIVCAFFPLMFYMTGISDDFVGGFPLTIGITLGVSLIIAIFLVPFMCYVFIKKGLTKTDRKKDKKSILDYVQRVYDLGVEWTFRNPKLTMAGAVVSVALGIYLFTLSDMQFFPSMDRKQFAVEVYLPESSSLDETGEVLAGLEELLAKDSRITNVASFVGSGSPRFHTLYAPHLEAKNYGQLMVNTISNEATEDILDEYAEKYRGIYPRANIKWKQIAIEDFNTPIEVRISGDSIKDLRKVEEQVFKIVDEHPNTTWVRDDWLEKQRCVSIKLDENKANRLGYAKSLIAASLMTALDGLPITTMWEGDYPIDVILSAEENLKDDVRDLADQYVSSPVTMESLPLRTVATLEPEWEEGCIVRRNGVRTITVQSDVKRGIIYSTVFNDIRPLIDAVELPKGVKITYGGDEELTQENIGPLIYSLGTSIVLIFFVLMLQFKTIRRSMLIMSCMLLSLLGASAGLLIVGYPFCMTAFIGVIGLVGITVRNGIILVDYAMHLVTNEGYSYKEAAIAAGKRRMRPIFLTSMAAAVGVIPMIVSASPLWGPLGTVICFGLVIGMILTLFTLPVLYWQSAMREKHNDSDNDDDGQQMQVALNALNE